MKIYIVLLTYSPSLEHPRHEYAVRTLHSTLTNLRFQGQISVHIADDGSPQEHRDALYKLAGGFASIHGVTVTNSERRGYGASYNAASQVTHFEADYILPLEDDWVLPGPLSIDPFIAALEDGLSCVRLGYIGYTQELRGVLSYHAGRHYLVFDPSSPERHVFAGHPRIESVRYERAIGPWPEGIDAGSTEFEVAGYEEARYGVAWPLGAPEGGYFHHIGTVTARTDKG